jgi:hypothetical protein
MESTSAFFAGADAGACVVSSAGADFATLADASVEFTGAPAAAFAFPARIAPRTISGFFRRAIVCGCGGAVCTTGGCALAALADDNSSRRAAVSARDIAREADVAPSARDSSDPLGLTGRLAASRWLGTAGRTIRFSEVAGGATSGARALSGRRTTSGGGAELSREAGLAGGTEFGDGTASGRDIAI